MRFELAAKALAPELKIIAPWREWKINSREEAIAYARSHNIPIEQTKKNIYSRDRNIWHLSHEGGVLEDPANAPDEAMWQWIVSPAKAPDKPTAVEIGFEAGTPVSVNGKKLAPMALLDELNEIAAAQRRRPHRHRRKSPRRHEVARRVRNSRRHSARHRASRTRIAVPRPRDGALSADALAALRRDGLLRHVVHAAARSARRILHASRRSA